MGWARCEHFFQPLRWFHLSTSSPQGHLRGCRAWSKEGYTAQTEELKTGRERHLGCRRADHLLIELKLTLRGGEGEGRLVTTDAAAE